MAPRASKAGSVDADRIRRFRQMWDDEIAGAALYRSLAECADEHRRPVLLSLAEAEDGHAQHWSKLLAEAGVTDLQPRRLPFRVKFLAFLARRLSAEAVLQVVFHMEVAGAEKYEHVPEAPSTMAAQERTHGKVVAALGGDTTGERIARSEGRHRMSTAGGALRAAVFGVNDGLVSNLLLVMGVAGGTSGGRFVLLAGVSGWLAGACSMAMGEWVSVGSQRELYEHEIDIEREELAHFPDEEREELALIYQAKGLGAQEAHALADTLIGSDQALEALTREELGFDVRTLGSPLTAAFVSFLAFSLGAVVPIVPFLVGSGTAAVIVAAVLSVVMLFAVGVGISVFTGSSAPRSGLRMAGVGVLVGAVSYGFGSLLGGVLDV